MKITAYLQKEDPEKIEFIVPDGDPIFYIASGAIPLLRDLEECEKMTDEEFDDTYTEVFGHTQEICEWVDVKLSNMGYNVEMVSDVGMSNQDSDDIFVLVFLNSQNPIHHETTI